jgi:hypothetical protein
MTLVLSGEPAFLVHKLRSVITRRWVIIRAESRYKTRQEIRRYGQVVAQQSSTGWSLRAKDGTWAPAGAGQAALYNQMRAFRG